MCDCSRVMQHFFHGGALLHGWRIAALPEGTELRCVLQHKGMQLFVKTLTVRRARGGVAPHTCVAPPHGRPRGA